ncbi:hypothetical protein K438DRAFT_2135065 [Mycena galopus ATCC 62051]|nr:hypothetical protein K438DRAFT_2135065 [Mycena galopus ATCC 62051]
MYKSSSVWLGNAIEHLVTLSWDFAGHFSAHYGARHLLDCAANFTMTGGLQHHQNSAHRQFTPGSDGEDDNTFKSYYHPKLNGTSSPCYPCPRANKPPALPGDADGHYLPPFSVPPPPPPLPVHGQDPAAWAPFSSRVEFDFAKFHFVKLQNSVANSNTALDLWAASVMQLSGTVPWKNSNNLYSTIDKIQSGHMPWQTYQMRYSSPLPPGTAPRWMMQMYEVCTHGLRAVFCHQLEKTSFKGDIDMVPYWQFNHAGKCIWLNLMSGDWAWKQVDILAEDPNNLSCSFVPIVAGSDKTTVSVTTGHQEYHPIYTSPGNLTGPTRHKHGNRLLPVAFLAIPKSLCLVTRVKNIGQNPHTTTQVSPLSIAAPMAISAVSFMVLALRSQIIASKSGWQPLSKTGAPSVPCPSTLFLKPFTDDFPRVDIYELLSSDLLHQVIKGTFKDHIVSWVNKYLHNKNREKQALEIIQDIDHRISAVPEFPGLRCFPDGRDFSQWTGDDLKALMKVNLTAVAGYLPSDMMKCLSAFMEFCYLVHRNAISAPYLTKIQDALDHFHEYRQIFITCGVRPEGALRSFLAPASGHVRHQAAIAAALRHSQPRIKMYYFGHFREIDGPGSCPILLRQFPYV